MPGKSPDSRTIRDLLEQALALADATDEPYVAVRIAEALDALTDRSVADAAVLHEDHRAD